MLQPETMPVFYTQLEKLYANPDIVIVGSLARAAIMGETIPPLKLDGSRRDIDFVNLSNQSCRAAGILKEADGPHRLDDICQEWITFGPNTSRLDCPYDHRLQEEVSSTVFQPYERRLGEVSVRTFDPLTQLHLQYMMGPLRPQDEQPVSRFTAHLEQRTDVLPEDLFEPFARFVASVARRRQSRSLTVAGSIGNVVHSVIPESVQQRTGPARRKIANSVVRCWGIIGDTLTS